MFELKAQFNRITNDPNGIKKKFHLLISKSFLVFVENDCRFQALKSSNLKVSKIQKYHKEALLKVLNEQKISFLNIPHKYLILFDTFICMILFTK